jgi:hypothetical protein
MPHSSSDYEREPKKSRGKGRDSGYESASSRSRSAREQSKEREKSPSKGKHSRDRKPKSGGSSSSKNENDTMSFLRDMFTQLSTEMVSTVTSKIDSKFDEKFESKVDPIMRTLSDVSKHVSDIDERIAQHEERINTSETRMEEIVESCRLQGERVEKALESFSAPPTWASVAAPSVSNPAPVSNAFDRAPNPKTLVFNLHGNPVFAKEELCKFVKGQLSDLSVVCDFDIPGRNTSKRFAVIFSGPGAEQTAQRLLLHRKDASGAWKDDKINVIDAAPAKVYIQPDKSPKQERIEMVLRKMATHLRALDTNLRISCDPGTGTVRVNGTQFANVQVSKDNATAKWNDLVFNDHEKLVKDEIKLFFKKAFTVEWSL